MSVQNSREASATDGKHKQRTYPHGSGKKCTHAEQIHEWRHDYLWFFHTLFPSPSRSLYLHLVRCIHILSFAMSLLAFIFRLKAAKGVLNFRKLHMYSVRTLELSMCRRSRFFIVDIVGCCRRRLDRTKRYRTVFGRTLLLLYIIRSFPFVHCLIPFRVDVLVLSNECTVFVSPSLTLH